jgi:tetratricopeptide (TPR) repeat protein
VRGTELRSNVRPSGARIRFTPPTWIRQAGIKPSAAELAALRDAVQDRPLDRGARNALVVALARAGKTRDVLTQTLIWQVCDPENPMVYEFAGDAFTRSGDRASALRAYTSIADVSPGDSGLLNRAGFLCLKGGEPAMAEDLFRFAIERRPDHANNYRGMALALWSQGRHEDAARALADASSRSYDGRYHDVHRILREDLSAVLSAWLEVEPAAKPRAQPFIDKWHAELAQPDALRFTLHWETDANDVDLHVVDPAGEATILFRYTGEESYYSHKENASGLQLYEDLTQGLGPERAVVPSGRLPKGSYHVGVNYYSAGPMGVSRGVVVIQRPSLRGKPNVRIETFCLLPDLMAGKDMRHVAVVEAEAVRSGTSPGGK